MEEKKKRVTFVLGSGISIDAGMPSTREITECICKGEHLEPKCGSAIITLLNGKEIPHEDKDKYKDNLSAFYAYKLLFHINQNRGEQLKPEEMANYEDLYSFLLLLKNGSGDKAIEAMSYGHSNILEVILADISLDYGEIESHPYNNLSLKESTNRLRSATLNHIETVVRKMLSKNIPIDSLEYFSVFSDAAKDQELDVNFITLNHDTLLEEWFEHKNISYVDGFEHIKGTFFRHPNEHDERDLVNEVSVWMPKQLFQVNPEKALLIKLHGSINWFPGQGRPIDAPHYKENDDGKTSIIVHEYIFKTKNEFFFHDKIRKATVSVDKERPVFLTGTFNKEMAYSKDIFMYLHIAASELINSSDVLVFCGYGFGDNGVNYMIRQWQREYNEQKQAIIVHKEPDKFIDHIDPSFGIGFHTGPGIIEEEITKKIERKLTNISEENPEPLTWKEIREKIQN